MPEYTRNLFMANGSLKAVEAFDDYFSPKHTYIYEVFRVIGGVPLFIEDHLDRFFHTTRLADTDAGCDREQLLKDILVVISANGGQEGNIKISIVQGKSGTDNLLIYFTPHHYPTPGQYVLGVPVRLLVAERNNPNAKVMDIPLRAETDLIKHADEVYEVLLVDRDGFITEGSRSNVFFIRGDVLITPPVDSVLPGITRKQLMALSTENGINCREEKVHSSDLSRFDALFISGTSRRVLPVNRVDDLLFSTENPLMTRLSGLFNKLVGAYIEKNKEV